MNYLCQTKVLLFIFALFETAVLYRFLLHDLNQEHRNNFFVKLLNILFFFVMLVLFLFILWVNPEFLSHLMSFDNRGVR